MALDIGSKYEETKAMLKEKIRKGAISALEAEATNHRCYFCGNHIEGKMWELKEKHPINGREAESNYYIDGVCYQNSKLFMDYYGVLFSLN